MRRLLCFLLPLALVLSCRQEKHEGEPVHSAYYWQTVFELDSCQHNFIDRHHVERLYIRLFDVTMQDGHPYPNATIRFNDSVPQHLETIPTVFILNECFDDSLQAENLDDLIYRRVRQMCATHDLPHVDELQIDCDWTASTQTTFFRFLRKLQERAHTDGWQLSSTIRLHQLRGDAPPADRGVLMNYHTGDIKDIHAISPILRLKDAEPYLKTLDDYPLPLACAYPNFALRTLYRHDRLVGIIHYDAEYPVVEGDSLVTWDTSVEEICKTRDFISALCPSANDEIILYDISQQNIHHFNNEQYEKIYHR